MNKGIRMMNGSPLSFVSEVDEGFCGSFADVKRACARWLEENGGVQNSFSIQARACQHRYRKSQKSRKSGGVQ